MKEEGKMFRPQTVVRLSVPPDSSLHLVNKELTQIGLPIPAHIREKEPDISPVTKKLFVQGEILKKSETSKSQTVRIERPSLIPVNRTHSRVTREFEGGKIRIMQVQERGKSPYQVIVCRRVCSQKERAEYGEHENCEIGPLSLIQEIKVDRGCLYFRTAPEEVDLPDRWAVFAHYQDMMVVKDARCEDRYILVSAKVAIDALDQLAVEEAKERLYKMFFEPYPWSTRKPELVRDGYSRTYLRINPEYLKGDSQ